LYKFSFISTAASILDSPIEYLKGVGPLRGDMLRKELEIFTFKDLLNHFPIRHIDKTSITPIAAISSHTEYAQIAGILSQPLITGEKKGRRLVAFVQDGSATLELTWFQGIHWIQKYLQEGTKYLIYGKISFFNGKPQIVHPEIEPFSLATDKKNYLEPVYSTTEKLKVKGLNGRQIGKLTSTLLALLSEKDIPENIPSYLLNELHFTNRYQAYCHLHFPPSAIAYTEALNRLKFEELFFSQLRLNLIRIRRNHFSKGVVF